MTEPRRPTDDAVANLPLHRGRAELLEEIMSTPVRDGLSVRTAFPRRSTAWLTPVAAAAVAAGLATIPLWAGDGPSPRGVAGASAAAQLTADASSDPSPESAEVGAHLVVLDAPGWQVEHANAGGLAVDYTSGAATLEIVALPASSYDWYVKDREHIVEPPAPGEPVEVLGRPAQLWAYSGDDHTVIREPEAGYSYEIRGQGLSKADYLDLLDQLRLVDANGFQAALPPRFVTAENDAVVQEMLDGIARVLGPARGLTPFGTPEAVIHSESSDRYQLGVDVASSVVCPWLSHYADGRRAGDEDAVTDAATALATAHRWPLLLEMDAEGDYPKVVWEYADKAAAGRDVDGYQGALGCD